MANLLTKLLKLINWKKTTIWTIIGLIITYCLTKWYIDNDLAILLSWILAALWITANIANAKSSSKNTNNE